MSKTINILFFFISINFYFSQTLSSSLNKNKIDLGEVITMKINVQNLQGKEIISAQKNGLLPFSFEEYKDDINQDRDQYTRIIEFTIFTEGMHQIPALEFKIGDSIHHTIPYEIEVYNSANPNEEINDILPNENINLTLYDYWQLYKLYILGILIIIVLIGLLWIYQKKKKLPKEKVNPTINYIKNIDALQNKMYIENGEYKLFYIELLEICKNYISNKYHIDAYIFLTDDLIHMMKNKQTIPVVPEEKIKVFEEIFTRGDLVKFAKTIPSTNIMKEDLIKIKKCIKQDITPH